MKKININDNWRFWKNERFFSPFWEYTGNYRTIDLPHDAMIEETPYEESPNKNMTGFHDGGNYTYEKHFFIPEEKRGKTLLLRFDGVYRMSQVYLNGYPIANHVNGYTAFYADMTDGVRFGEDNEIRVVVRNAAMPNSRWYSGSGIYRDVYLLEGGEIYIDPQSLQALTKNADTEMAEIEVGAVLINRGNQRQDISVRFTLMDKNENIVSEKIIPLPLMTEKAQKVHTTLYIDEPQLWDEEHPDLYMLRAEIRKEEQICDTEESIFGIRTLSLDPKRGLQVNGKSIKLRGACIHHDNGILGAACYAGAEYRKVKLLKEAGFNAIRMSHHPMSEHLLLACDRLGMYVMDETFDMWNRSKSDYDYSLSFNRCWEEDVEAMVRKDFNHPSVLMYSLGNEIPEISHDSGIVYLRKLHEKVKSLDPSRYTTTAITSPFLMGDENRVIFQDVMDSKISSGDEKINLGEADVNEFLGLFHKYTKDMNCHPIFSKRLERVCAVVDIGGYNYLTERYPLDHEKSPERIIVGSETYPPQIGENWYYVKAYKNLIGDFTWTGMDYLGEAGIGVVGYTKEEGGFGAAFPCQVAYCGDIDLTGYRRPISYYREIAFGLRKKPYIAVNDPSHFGKEQYKTAWTAGDQIASWTFPGMEGLKTTVEVYSASPFVELFQDGESLGIKECGEEKQYTAVFEVIYKPGILEAKAFGTDYKTETCCLKTVIDAKPVISTEKIQDDLWFMTIEFVDAEGNLDLSRNTELEITMNKGDLIAFGSADPKPSGEYHSNRTKAFQGRALAVVKSADEPSVDIHNLILLNDYPSRDSQGGKQ